MSEGKRIGFVDYDLENFHANVYLAAFRNELRERGYDVAGCTALMENKGKAWAEKNGVTYYEDLDSLNREVDYYMVLAPSNPETHLQLCSQVFPHGKATYVDKTFAPDLDTARTIFALADQYRTPVQTTSALRYTNVQQYVQSMQPEKALHMVSWGGGRSFAEYAIHPLEMAVSCMGADVTSLLRRGEDPHTQLLLNFTGGRTAVVNVYTGSDTPFAAAVTSRLSTRLIAVDSAHLFIDVAAAVLDFFDSGLPAVNRQESLVIRQVLDAAQLPASREGFIAL